MMYDEHYYLGRDIFECEMARKRQLRGDQKFVLNAVRDESREGVLVSIGCGIGDLENALAGMGFCVVASDPSADAIRVCNDRHADNQHLLYMVCGGLGKMAELSRRASIVVFCESLEHIPEPEIREALPRIMTPGKLVIFSNEFPGWPINTNGYDHITTIDNSFMDWVASLGEVMYREKATMVIKT